MRCTGCNTPFGAGPVRVVPGPDSPDGMPYAVCGTCGSTEWSGDLRRRESIDTETDHDQETMEPSWEPWDNCADDWTADRRAAEVLECLQARVGFDANPTGAVITRMVARSWWN